MVILRWKQRLLFTRENTENGRSAFRTGSLHRGTAILHGNFLRIFQLSTRFATDTESCGWVGHYSYLLIENWCELIYYGG
jgi:hypothetical protein